MSVSRSAGTDVAGAASTVWESVRHSVKVVSCYLTGRACSEAWTRKLEKRDGG